MLCVQVADFLFGNAALPHDFLHEPLLRILATGFAGASTAAASLNVGHPANCKVDLAQTLAHMKFSY